MELYQRRIISKKDTDGLELNWGNEEAVIKLLEKIANRDGFGDVLADGCVVASKRIGRGAEKYLITVKGMPMLGEEDPRCYTKLAKVLSIMTSPRGGDDLKGTHGGHEQEEYLNRVDQFENVKKEIYDDTSCEKSLKRQAALTKWCQELACLYDSVGICMIAGSWGGFGPTLYTKLLSAGTGLKIKPPEAMKVGERIFNLLRAYIVREGLTRKDDRLPRRFYRESISEGPSVGAKLNRNQINSMLDRYYELRGWDAKTGCPTSEKLHMLGLDQIINEITRNGRLCKNDN